ncbi:MAG: creatininase family protein [bacterium]|nr:creatininase family protein [bacterium]
MLLPYQHVRFEQLTPGAVARALAGRPVVYIPMGTYEYHGPHLPVGLDALKAYELCLRAADQTGGVVMPPFFYGTGGGHIGFPCTIMIDRETIENVMGATLDHLARWGVKVAVFFTGHYPVEQVDMVKQLAERKSSDAFRVLALSDCMLPNPPFRPDHAAIFETTMYKGLNADLVHLERLPDPVAAPANDPGGQPFGAHRWDPKHPLYGILGGDPREFDPTRAEPLVSQTLRWMTGLVEEALAGLAAKDT